ncbi:MAG: MarR family transcriptional regulator [Bacteroidales bacterium]|nr:MarR family transcriptional regulator [Bacteroidales bacterium]
MEFHYLKLENQLCFPIYAASRLIIREYQPFLEKLNITYPQYLVMMILWENDSIAVSEIAKKLILNTNTITPILKRMEQQGLIVRTRSDEDERKVFVTLTELGQKLKEEAAKIPEALINRLLNSELKVEDLIKLKESLNALISFLSK